MWSERIAYCAGALPASFSGGIIGAGVLKRALVGESLMRSQAF
jgi:hypothetical protein